MKKATWRIVITRTPEKNEAFGARLEGLGFNCLKISSIDVRPRVYSREEQETIVRLQLGGFDWLLLTSPNGVSCLRKALQAHGRKNAPYMRSGQLIAVQGEGTAERLLEEFQRKPDLMPDFFVGEGMIEAFNALEVRERSFLYAGSSKARGVIQNYLLEREADVMSLDLYDTQALPASEALMESLLGHENLIFTFFSPSAFESILKSFSGSSGKYGHILSASKIISIGPVTSRCITGHGFLVDFEARSHSEDGVLEVLRENFK